MTLQFIGQLGHKVHRANSAWRKIWGQWKKQGHPLATRFGKLEVTHKKWKLGRECGVWKGSEEGRGAEGGAALLYLFTAQRCVPLARLTLGALSCQPTVLDLHYDLWQLWSQDTRGNSLPRCLFWPNSATWDTWMSRIGAEDAAIQYPPISPTRIKTLILFQETGRSYSPVRALTLTLDCLKTAYLSLFM